jgi:8-oxo-dGTP pyrophosphatase MutT (NUDIX family)
METSKYPKTLSCGIVVVRQANEWQYLMMRSYSYWETGGKGKQQAGESDFETALRETEEETGLKLNDLDFKWGRVFKDTEPYAQDKVARFFIAETSKQDIVLKINKELGKPEHNEYRWCSYDEASRLVGARIQTVLDWAQGVVNES